LKSISLVKRMTIRALVENEEAFAKLNYLRDMAFDPDLSSWSEEKDVYLKEASCKQAQRGYVLTLEEMNAILELIYPGKV
jgi:hypothetical protein